MLINNSTTQLHERRRENNFLSTSFFLGRPFAVRRSPSHSEFTYFSTVRLTNDKLMPAAWVFSDFWTCLKRRSRSRGEGAGEDGIGESWELFFELRTLQIATNFFSDLNQLGHGGFGPVYKGLLPNGELIAVKKLALTSRQGMKEFTNEVKFLLKVQHKNLVRLLGCCVEGPEKMLVYEYLPNKSLDYFLFDEEKSGLLDWQKRFRIISGVARGLLYLHEEAPVKILHRDIKASNILLDEQLDPKISDFGLARLFPDEETHLNTFRIAGTHGYMAPEYAVHGYLSVKTDVFSFGILVLEMISGRKNHDKEKSDILSCAWTLFQRGKLLELVDPQLSFFNVEQASMCILLGLLCCQASVRDRPNMNFIRNALSSDSFTLPTPGLPGIHGRVGRWTANTTSTLTNTKPNSSYTSDTRASSNSLTAEDYSRNSMSISSIGEGR